MSTTTGPAYEHLFRKGVPAAAPRFTGFPKYNFIGGHNDPTMLPVEALADCAAIAGDIDRKIDEALELAERMKAPKANAVDDLDVPAFLRNGLKDLPLG